MAYAKSLCSSYSACTIPVSDNILSLKIFSVLKNVVFTQAFQSLALISVNTCVI